MGNVGRPPVRKRDVKNKERHYEKMELGTPTLDGLGSIGREGGNSDRLWKRENDPDGCRVMHGTLSLQQRPGCPTRPRGTNRTMAVVKNEGSRWHGKGEK